MSLKAGWIALFAFVWIIGIFLGATFEYQDSDVAQGQAYVTGTANFTYGDATVYGVGTVWVAGMEGGNMKSDTDGVWYKISSVTNNTELELTAVYAQAGGGGHAYTMAVSPGWSGSGSGGYDESPTTTMGVLMNAKNVIQRNPVIGIISVVTNGDFWKAAFKIITWQFSFLYNADGTMAYGLFYWIVCFPFVLMGMLSILLLVYGVITGNLSL